MPTVLRINPKKEFFQKNEQTQEKQKKDKRKTKEMEETQEATVRVANIYAMHACITTCSKHVDRHGLFRDLSCNFDHW